MDFKGSLATEKCKGVGEVELCRYQSEKEPWGRKVLLELLCRSPGVKRQLCGAPTPVGQ